MTLITRSALVERSAEQMFDLVNDVVRYPEFIQGCDAARVIEQREGFLEAELSLSASGFQQNLTTRNTLVRPDSMEIKLVNGPFSQFSGGWKFQKLSDNACKVTFELNFKMKNPLKGAAMSMVFKQLAGKVVDSFVERAKVVYD